MCKDIEGATQDCAFKTHELKCPNGHPLHLSKGKTFLCCRSGCYYVEFLSPDNIEAVQKQLHFVPAKERGNKK